jgi:hypothetical protein
MDVSTSGMCLEALCIYLRDKYHSAGVYFYSNCFYSVSCFECKDKYAYIVNCHGGGETGVRFFTPKQETEQFIYQVSCLLEDRNISNETIYIDPIVSLHMKLGSKIEELTDSRCRKYGRKFRRIIRCLLLKSENISIKRFRNLYRRYREKRLNKNVISLESVALINWVSKSTFPYEEKSYNSFFKVYHRLKSVEGIKELVKNVANTSYLV